MIIGGKRKEEVISTRDWYKSVHVSTRHGWHVWLFKSKVKAERFALALKRARKAHQTDWLIMLDRTGHQTVDGVARYYGVQFDVLASRGPAISPSRAEYAEGWSRVYWSAGAENTLTNFGF